MTVRTLLTVAVASVLAVPAMAAEIRPDPNKTGGSVEYHTPVQWQAHSPKRARKQAEVRLCEALLVSFRFDDSKTRGAAERCHRQAPKECLRLPKI